MIKLSIIVPSKSCDRRLVWRLLANVGFCPVSYEFIVVSYDGIGFARHAGVLRSTGNLIVMFDDDVILNPKIWSYILNLSRGTFFMAVNCGNISTRAFAIHRQDYDLIGGFDPTIKYCFEDGDFYVRALRQGLTCKFIPTTLCTHLPHLHRTTDRWLLVRLSWEYTHMLVKYKRYVFKNMFEFFVHPRDWRLFLWSFVTRVVGTLYWLLKGVD